MLEHIEWVAGGWSLTFVTNPSDQKRTAWCLRHTDLSSLLFSSSLVPMNSLLSTQDSYRFGGPIGGPICGPTFGSICGPIFSSIFGSIFGSQF